MKIEGFILTVTQVPMGSLPTRHVSKMYECVSNTESDENIAQKSG